MKATRAQRQQELKEAAHKLYEAVVERRRAELNREAAYLLWTHLHIETAWLSRALHRKSVLTHAQLDELLKVYEILNDAGEKLMREA